MIFEVHETVNGLQKLIRKVEGISTSEFAGVIKEDIWQNFVQSRSVRGGRLMPLSRGRILDKFRKGFSLPSKVLVASGQLAEATFVRNKNKNESHVLVKSGRSKTADGSGRVTNIQILKWQQNVRPVWGLSERVEKLLKKRLEAIAKK